MTTKINTLITIPAALRRALLTAALCAGCGYTTGLHLAPGHDSIGVELFRNDSPVRDLERDLHAALARSTRKLVDAPLVPPGQASLVAAELRIFGEGPGPVPGDGLDVGADEGDLARAIQLGDIEDRRRLGHGEIEQRAFAVDGALIATARPVRNVGHIGAHGAGDFFG